MVRAALVFGLGVMVCAAAQAQPPGIAEPAATAEEASAPGAELVAEPAPAAEPEPAMADRPAAAEPSAPPAVEAPVATDDPLTGMRDITELSLDDFLATELDVAAKKKQSLREAPAVLTVVTREEIAAMGARDLLDVLVLVPGFVPAQDAQNAIGAGFRGLWSGDGRHLLLVDGQEMNEPFYTNVRLNNRFPVDQIERIEIIRGPGSVIYGGYAELAVINIVTRGAEHQRGAAFTGTYGVYDADRGRRTTLSASYAQRFADLDDLGASLAIFAGRANGSGHPYTDLYGETYRMTRAAGTQEPLFANLGLCWRDLKLRFIYDGYQAIARDHLDLSTGPYRIEDIGYYAEARYDLRLSETMTLTPRLSFKRQQPWRVTQYSAPSYYLKTAERTVGNLTFSWELLPQLTLLAGVEGYLEQARLDKPDRCDTTFQCSFLDGAEVDYHNVAGFVQALLKTASFGSLTLGARLEDHSAVGSSFVPRAAYTLVAGPFHAKLMAAQAFRAPGIENINAVPTDAATGDPLVTRPETTTALEVELGYKLGEWGWIALNAFDITIKDPISYYYTQSSEGYLNFDETGTQGIEVEARLKRPGYWATLGYSYYHAGSFSADNLVPQYAVPVADNVDPALALTDPDGYRQDVLLGWPQHKLTLVGAAEVHPDFWLSATVFLLSTRYGYLSGVLDDATGELLYERIGAEDPVAVGSLFLTKRNFATHGLSLVVGVHNLTDGLGGMRYRYVEGYAGSHPPSPAPSREYFVRLAWDQGAP